MTGLGEAHRDGKRPTLPVGVENQFTALAWQRARAGHLGNDGTGATRFAHEHRTLLTPIMDSRSISFASCCSLRCSVFSGRCGSTRYRISALLSQTRTSTSSSSVVPNSASMLRGSMTTRDRYAASLYQVGGNPSTGQG